MRLTCLLLFLTLGLLSIGHVSGQAMVPELPEKYNPKTYGPLFKGINQCAYKNVQTNDGKTVQAWICGPVDQKDTKVVYDCCPGYQRSSIVNNECVEKTPTYNTIISTLQDMKYDVTPEALSNAEPALDKNGKDFTVFVSDYDSSIQDIKPKDVENLIVEGRHYSGDLKTGTELKTKSGYPLKVSTYRNGLVFVECQLLTKPDYETSNGIIHFTSGPIDASKSYGTVMDRLRSDPELSAFTADIPSDLRSQLSAPNSKEKYTVFAPNNQAWNEAKRGLSDPQAVGDLVRQHVQESLICGQSIDDGNRLIGPSAANTYIRGNQLPDGSRVLEDSCGGRATFNKMDMMAGNGVVHKLSSALKSPASLSLKDALNCLANGPDKELSQGAREMAACNIDVRPSDNAVVLLPNSEALKGASSKGCPLYQNHVLTSNECKMKNGFGIGTPQECLYTSKYTAPGGRKPTYTNQYIRNRDGSTLHFGKAETTGVKPIPFRGGVIYPVKSVNPPPTKTMMEIIRENPDLSTTYENMQKSGYTGVLSQKAPNVVFFAPQNHGWKTRDKENSYSPGQLQKLFDLQTIPHQIITGKDGNVDSETVQTLKSASGVDLKVIRHLDGNTFIGHDSMPKEHWALAIGDPIIASDGVVQVVDWPLICPNC